MQLAGTYKVMTPGGLVTVTLRVAADGRLEGELRAAALALRLAGVAEGLRAEGTATNDAGASVVFQLEGSADQLAIQLVDLASGGVDALVLQRREAPDAPDAPPPAVVTAVATPVATATPTAAPLAPVPTATLPGGAAAAPLETVPG